MTTKKQLFIAFFMHQWKVTEVTKEQSLLPKKKKIKEEKRKEEGKKLRPPNINILDFLEGENLKTIMKIHAYFWTN